MADAFFDENLRTISDGRLVPLEVEVFEGGLPAGTISRNALKHPFTDADGDLEADVFDQDDDNDQMPDWWELRFGLNPLDASDAGQDPDMDGLTNLQEFRAGSDPNSPNVFVDGFESGNAGAWSSWTP